MNGKNHFFPNDIITLRFRERELREKMKSEIRKWRIEETRKEEEMKSYNEMVEFEKRQEFYENLPLMKEAADRREKMRLAKVEERKQHEIELEEERKRKEAILDSIRAQVAIEVCAFCNLGLMCYEIFLLG